MILYLYDNKPTVYFITRVCVCEDNNTLHVFLSSLIPTIYTVDSSLTFLIPPPKLLAGFGHESYKFLI